MLTCPEAGFDVVPDRILIWTCLFSTLWLHSFLSERLSGSLKEKCECVFVILTAVWVCVWHSGSARGDLRPLKTAVSEETANVFRTMKFCCLCHTSLYSRLQLGWVYKILKKARPTELLRHARRPLTVKQQGDHKISYSHYLTDWAKQQTLACICGTLIVMELLKTPCGEN